MSWIIVFILIIFSIILVVITKLLFSKFFSVAEDKERTKLIKDTKESLKKLSDLLNTSEDLASKLQLNTIVTQYNQASAALEAEKNNLRSLEANLKVARKKMEEKEILQQELKTSKEEDEHELQLLLNEYEKNSEESRSLEKVLADQIKLIDESSKDQNLPSIQRDFFYALNETLEESGSNFRAVITEYEQMFQRLSALKQQLLDLEQEYAKLVESKISS